MLLDDTRWRDELAFFNLGLDSPDKSAEGGLEINARKEVLDIIIRLLFGVMLGGKGKSKGPGAGDRRKAVLNALAGCGEDELGLLVDLMLRPFGWNRDGAATSNSAGAGDKQISGFLTLLGDVLKGLGSRMVKYWPVLIEMTIGLTSAAQACVTGLEEEVEETNVDEEGILDDLEVPEDTVASPSSSSLSSSSPKIVRSIRQLGLKRFADFFRIPVTFDFSSYMRPAFASFITPRLPVLDRENTQSPSALLELFHVWTTDSSFVPFLVHYDPQTLPKLYDCLVATNVKPSVISRVFDVVDNLLGYSAESELIRESVLKPHVSNLLSNLAILVERTKGTSSVATPIAQRQISIFSEIAQYSTDSSQASTLLGLFSPWLRKPPKIVPEKVKVNLVKIIGDLMRLIPDLQDRQTSTYQKTYTLISQLFQTLRSRPARLSLISTFHRFAAIDLGLQELAQLLEGMNAYSTKRMDEPDFDRRLAAFSDLNENLYRTISCSDWLPILYNMLSFIQDPVELSVRNSASYTMRHFIDIVAATETTSEYEEMFLRVLFSGLKNGLRSKNEMVRMEVLGVIAYSVEQCQRIAPLQEMRHLLEGGDEEANFFNNILHVQVHRRSRALRRLADHCEQGNLRSSTLVDIFIPLVGNYIMSTSSVDHHLVNDAILATGRMAKHISWGAYHGLVQKYLKLSRVRDESERVYVRALVALLENFHFPMEEVVPSLDTVNEDAAEDDGDEEIIVVPDHGESVALSFKTTARIADAVNLRLLPNLLNHLEKHDATTDDNTRIPISIGIVVVAKYLPAAAREAQITRLVTILSQILRSKSQETRDLTRDAFNRITVNLGPSYLPLILRELRAALTRGPQLHVLAYAIHSLMVYITSGEHAGTFSTLDDCVNDVAFVSAEVIFGESGKDVQAEDFKTKMREVRASSSGGLDSFAIMVKYVTPAKISSLLLPLKTIMQETSSIKVMNLVEEVLKRMAVGLNGNQHLVPTELLVLCHTLVSQNAKFLQQTPVRRKSNVKGNAIVQLKRQVTAETNHYSINSYR
jgi:U3 small nucleolar RNA-associated protein 20